MKPLNDPLRDLPGYALRRASAHSMATLAAALDAIGLRPVAASTLILIEANPGISLSRLGSALGIQRANMTPLIARLDARGLIARTATDGRSQGLSLTREGVDLTAKARVIVNAYETALMAAVPVAHRAQFIWALQAIWAGPHP